jgi:hypothetical protein
LASFKKLSAGCPFALSLAWRNLRAKRHARPLGPEDEGPGCDYGYKSAQNGLKFHFCSAQKTPVYSYLPANNTVPS